MTYQELIKVGAGNISGQQIQTVNARELHSFLEVGKDYATWIKDRIAEYNFKENEDFVFFPNFGEKSKRGRPAKDYHLTIDMAKELSMVERTEKGRIARKYFIECERRLKEEAARPKQLAFTLAPDEKRCTRCKQMKPYGEFNRDTTTKDGHRSYCIECNREVGKEYRRRNKTMNKLRAGGTERDEELAKFIHTILVTDPDYYDGPDNAQKALCQLIAVAQQMTHVHELCSFMSVLTTMNAVPENISTRILAAARDTKIIRNNVFRILERVAGSTQQAIKYPEQITQGDDKKAIA